MAHAQRAIPDRSTSNRDGVHSPALPAPVRRLFVIPSRARGGFHATIRGQTFELADPDSAHTLAPTPEDLLIASIASDVAWTAQKFLRAQGLRDAVSVSGAWKTHLAPPRLASIDVTVILSSSAATVSAPLIAALETCLAARSLKVPVHVRVEGA